MKVGVVQKCRCLDDGGGQGIPINNSSWEIRVPVNFSSSIHMLVFYWMNAFTLDGMSRFFAAVTDRVLFRILNRLASLATFLRSCNAELFPVC